MTKPTFANIEKGQILALRFHTNAGSCGEPFTEKHMFLGIDTARPTNGPFFALFPSWSAFKKRHDKVSKFSDPESLQAWFVSESGDVWHAYYFEGSWRWGSSAHRLAIESRPADAADDTLTPAAVALMVAEIAEIADDYERAHANEDALHLKVLRAIANGAPNAAELAAEAIKTDAIDFARHCA